jgi:hypothetical protein
VARQIAAPNINLSTGPLTLVDLRTTQEVIGLASDLTVGGVSGEQIRTLARTVVPVDAGDILEVDGWQRVTNDIGTVRYTCGVGFWVDVYDVDDGLSTSDPSRMWTRVSSLNGQNVDRSIVHHLPLTLSGVVWKVPDNWPAGHRATVCFRADAHSTAWNSNGGADKITVDNYGVLTVRRWKPMPPAVDDPRWADVEQRLAALETATPPEALPCP